MQMLKIHYSKVFRLHDKEMIFINIEDLMKEFDIESDEDFIYFEQFSAVMESELTIDYDIFLDLIMMPEREALATMTESFFEDLIKGIPDNDMELYSQIQGSKDVLTELARLEHERSMGFFAHELFRFREWFVGSKSVNCSPESGGDSLFLNPCEAMMLYREEKLSGNKYYYDFSENMYKGPDSYTLEILAEIKSESQNTDNFDTDIDSDEYKDIDALFRKLPEEYDPDSYDPEVYSERPIDPYLEGFVDRNDPVIDNLDGGYDEDGDDNPYLKNFSEYLQ